MNYVIGSGPAAISAAMALVTRGVEVTILDTGKTLEPERLTMEIANRAMGGEKAANTNSLPKIEGRPNGS